jgi:hypothetical protein
MKIEAGGYHVVLANDGNHTVHITKTSNRGRDYLSVIKPGSQNWKRAVRLAAEAAGPGDYITKNVQGHYVVWSKAADHMVEFN